MPQGKPGRLVPGNRSSGSWLRQRTFSRPRRRSAGPCGEWDTTVIGHSFGWWCGGCRDPGGPQIYDAGRSGGMGPQQRACGAGVRDMGAGRDGGGTQRRPLGVAVDLFGPLAFVLRVPELAGGGEWFPIRSEPHAETVANPSGYRPDCIGVRPQLAARLVVEAMEDVGGCPARHPPDAQD